MSYTSAPPVTVGRRGSIAQDEVVGPVRRRAVHRHRCASIARTKRRRCAREHVHLDVGPVRRRRPADDREVRREGSRTAGEVDERARECVRAVGEGAGGVGRGRAGDRRRAGRAAVERRAGHGGERLARGHRDRACTRDRRAVHRCDRDERRRRVVDTPCGDDARCRDVADAVMRDGADVVEAVGERGRRQVRRVRRASCRSRRSSRCLRRPG